MSDDNSRREFLCWLGVSSGAMLLTKFGCRPQGQPEAKPDAGGNVDDAGDVCEATASDVEGPFFESGAPQRTVLAPEDEPGQRLIVEGTVYGPDCETPVAEAVLDVWHADDDGNYHGGQEDDYRLRGQLKTDEQGRYRFETIVPGHYPEAGGMRPAHIHFSVTSPGFAPLTTQMYFEGDPYLAPDDPCGICSSDEPTLIVALEDSDGQVDATATFDIVLEQL